MRTVKALTHALIACESVTPDDAGCHTLIEKELALAGFRCEHLDHASVKNLWATHGNGAPYFVFAGHSDVVPPGDLDLWHTPPFEPTEKDGLLYGRGACDMKAALAAMVCAARDYAKANPNHPGTIALLITSDEEGPAEHGTRHAVEILQSRGIQFDCCIIGEPSSSERLADTIKIGRRGSLHADIQLIGQSGHVAYPETVNNPAHLAAGFIQALCNERWDNKTLEAFPATSLQITSLASHSSAGNTTPETAHIHINWRYSPATSSGAIAARVEAIADSLNLYIKTEWKTSAEPFMTTRESDFISQVQNACEQHTGYHPVLSTSGGTSDGRFIRAICSNLVELGMVNKTIHQINEHIPEKDIEVLKAIYFTILLNVSRLSH
ncbi:MAG: succinyl-diaminopimelate desuccinylase [Gammaproteobacteria bacterium CG11_big_fil_rev_8_21_14_0_20_46_22]|nr:MAG: succinyl-diaminopimelate desuccinylase [Gammaproteobacteria bacterium CG12_big_fil_rev_8_21_14_0_65_46_12]PIR10932.1 MAG: succinyl-diaminopimelate desuccinylase [Gammaproteobacteria bacterium CG11_big_fil_rev_8_21_14_0_20_46_22]